MFRVTTLSTKFHTNKNLFWKRKLKEMQAFSNLNFLSFRNDVVRSLYAPVRNRKRMEEVVFHTLPSASKCNSERKRSISHSKALSGQNSPLSAPLSRSHSRAPRAMVSGTEFTYENIRRNEEERICPGCGVKMQNADPNSPGFFIEPAKKASQTEDSDLELSEEELSEFEEEETEVGKTKKPEDSSKWVVFEKSGSKFVPVDVVAPGIPETDRELDRNALIQSSFAPLGYDLSSLDESEREKVLGEWNALWQEDDDEVEFLGKGKRKKFIMRPNAQDLEETEGESEEEEGKKVVCARCHSLRFYGQVRNPHLNPNFISEHLISPKFQNPKNISLKI